MIYQTTNGVKVTVEPFFEGRRRKGKKDFYIFSYQISIENQSDSIVQLINRHWDIFDSLNGIKVVEGPGVVGEQPILAPNEVHTYKSMCVLISTYGYMTGYFEMINYQTQESFEVDVPMFELVNPSILN